MIDFELTFSIKLEVEKVQIKLLTITDFLSTCEKRFINKKNIFKNTTVIL